MSVDLIVDSTQQTKFYIESRLTNRVPYWDSVFKPTYITKSTHYESNTIVVEEESEFFNSFYNLDEGVPVKDLEIELGTSKMPRFVPVTSTIFLFVEL